MKHIGFLSFGHWSPQPGSQTRTAADALLQSVELAHGSLADRDEPYISIINAASVRDHYRLESVWVEDPRNGEVGWFPFLERRDVAPAD